MKDYKTTWRYSMGFVLFVCNVLVWGFVFRFFGKRLFGKK